MNRKAFTLAETLVTLSILGVVAALTIPSLVHKFQDRMQISAMKKAYSMIDNALQQMYAIEGVPSKWGDWPITTYATEPSNFFASKLSNYLPVQKYCGSGYGCMQTCKLSASGVCGGGSAISGPGSYSTLTNEKYTTTSTDYNNNGKMLLKNGMYVFVYSPVGSGKNPNYYFGGKNPLGLHLSPYIAVDVNGRKGPNRYGYDVFYFLFNDWGLHTKVDPNDRILCLKESSRASNFQNGRACSAYILKYNNMDYKYRDVGTNW